MSACEGAKHSDIVQAVVLNALTVHLLPCLQEKGLVKATGTAHRLCLGHASRGTAETAGIESNSRDSRQPRAHVYRPTGGCSLRKSMPKVPSSLAHSCVSAAPSSSPAGPAAERSHTAVDGTASPAASVTATWRLREGLAEERMG